MIAKVLSIGVTPLLDFEESIRVKLINIVSLVFLAILFFFIGLHTFYTHKYEVAIFQFLFALIVPLIYYLHYKEKYSGAKIVFFGIINLVIFILSMFLLPGKGVENFYIGIIILVLILVSKSVWVYSLTAIVVTLYILPHIYLNPYPVENYSFITSIIVIISIVLAVRFFIIIQDQFKERLKLQNDHLEKLNEEKNDLMSIVAHDLKNPLIQIKGFVSILELNDNQLNTEQKKLIEKIKGVTDNQHKQITGFLDAKSFENSFEEMTFEKVRVRQLLETVLDEMLAQAIAKGIQLNYIKDAERNLSIQGRKDWLYKVISNLISNAIKFSSSGTKITIEVKSTDLQVIIIVRDQGQGFNKEEVKYIFKKNKILSDNSTTDDRSSGVGLYIVKKYVGQMHGTVTVESEEGKGSTFFITLPK